MPTKTDTVKKDTKKPSGKKKRSPAQQAQLTKARSNSPAAEAMKVGQILPEVNEQGEDIIADKPEVGEVLFKCKSILQWEPPENTVEGMQQRISQYLDYCIMYCIKPSVSGLCIAIHRHRQTILEYEAGKYGSKYTDMMKRTKQFIQMVLDEFAFRGQINPVAWIFYGKNYFGMVDKVEHVVETKNALTDDADISEIQKRLGEGYTKE